MAGHHRIAVGLVLLHVEVVRAVAHEHVELLERAWVEQLLDPLAGGVLAALVLLGHGLLGAGVDRLVAQVLELLESLGVGLGCLVSHGVGEFMAFEIPLRAAMTLPWRCKMRYNFATLQESVPRRRRRTT